MKVSSLSQSGRDHVHLRGLIDRVQLNIIAVMLAMTLLFVAVDQSAAYHKDKHGHVKIKVWRGPSHGYKKHKYAPFGYYFSVDEKHH